MTLDNKMTSYHKRVSLGLNRFPEVLICNGEFYKVDAFLDKYDAKYYAVRSIDIVGYKSKIKILKESVALEVVNHNNFSLSVSSHNYDDALLLIGDVKIDYDDNVWLLASTDEYPKISKNNPDYNLSTTVFDKKLNNVRGFDSLFSYIVEHGLVNVIVEFAVYDEPVGICNEKVIVFEIRTDY